jgi:hypothetical protein
VAFQDGFERLLKGIESEEFVFIVNGESLKSTVFEAIFISPKIDENIRNCPGFNTFCIDDKSITIKDLSRFIDFVHSRVFQNFSREEQFSFVSICRLFGNESLTFLLIESLRITTDMKGTTKEESFVFPSPSKTLELTSFDVNHCASNFYLYSVELLRNVSKSMLHNIVKSPFLKLVNEDEFLKVLIELGSEYLEFWNYIEVVNLTSDGISLFVDNLDFNELSESIWEQIIHRLKGELRNELRLDRYVKEMIQIESLIVDNYPTILKEFRKNPWKLLYRGSRDGFKASDFHGKCDNESNTVTLIETMKGFIFGGFTPIPWDSSNTYKSDNSQKSFLFTLKNANNISPRKFSLSDASHAIRCLSDYGPLFGSGHDILIYDNCNANTNSYTNFGSGYVNDTGIGGGQVLAGEYNFTVKEIEVFTIIL